MIYLDYQATTPLAPEARDAMLRWLDGADGQGFGNPHSSHRLGRSAAAAVELARDRVAALFPPGGSVVFTSGATEALNTVLKGSRGNVLTFATEHSAVRDCAVPVERQGRQFKILPVGDDGIADLAALRGAANKQTGIIAAMMVNNEIGSINPLADITAIARENGALVLCDGVQAYGRIEMAGTCDFIAVSAHKIHGPKGIGALWIRDGLEIDPLLHGGGQEGAVRSGTLSPALCAGFGAAAKVAAERMQDDADHIAGLWIAARARFEGWELNGSAEARWQGNLNIRKQGLDVARLMSDARTLCFSAGSACASGSGRPSHVLKAIGLDDAAAKSSIRLGFGRYTTMEELDQGIDAILKAVKEQGL
ncbi:cysteine desulfurase [Altererythrobacter sp. RZ02]|uniref:Cysteine desulfurase n=1 Tax=Pontixanthobacter rizhaonensis TaxID=2730337 RepID=A0A848QJM1_9SPHN|nr:cysteine desulfurase family protein [Pontixanthobacter rizhaonensis]NMW30873.1 cysteine desulfurase [Pontixanthobacter rizhaonensis]